MSAISELTALRISVARVAQAMEVDNYLRISNLTYTQLFELATKHDSGWNNLCALMAEKVLAHREESV